MRLDCKSNRAESFLFCIINAYIRCGRIANPTERNLSCFALQMLILGAVGLQIRPSKFFLFCIINAYTWCGRIANPTERQIRPSGSFQDYYKQK